MSRHYPPLQKMTWVLIGGPADGTIMQTLDFNKLHFSNQSGDIYLYSPKDVVIDGGIYRVGWTTVEPSFEQCVEAIELSGIQPYQSAEAPTILLYIGGPADGRVGTTQNIAPTTVHVPRMGRDSAVYNCFDYHSHGDVYRIAVERNEILSASRIEQRIQKHVNRGNTP